MVRSLVALAALAGLGAAHFTMLYPDSIGFEDDNEDKAPCGGFTPDFSKKVVDFHVGGDALAMKNLHTQCNWLFRATTDQKAQSGWQQLFPIVQQSGLGDFCQPRVTAPADFAGKKGVVGVVSSAVDGLLYQCVAVNFVEGSADAPSQCANTSSVKASFASDSKLTALVGDAASTSSSSSSSSSGSASPSASGAASGSGASPAAGPGWSGATVAVFAGAVVGGMLLG